MSYFRTQLTHFPLITFAGARAVAKLVAKRLGLVDPIDDETGEEL
jgi:hypothetical protein